MKNVWYSFILVGLLISCEKTKQPEKQILPTEADYVILEREGVDCNHLPTTFSSYSEAARHVENAHFAFKDEVNTSKSSWIRGAKYFSCDAQFGFFMLTTNKQDYLYQDLPIDIWEGFKNASSFGHYYNSTIKSRYLLQVTQVK